MGFIQYFFQNLRSSTSRNMIPGLPPVGNDSCHQGFHHPSRTASVSASLVSQSAHTTVPGSSGNQDTREIRGSPWLGAVMGRFLGGCASLPGLGKFPCHSVQLFFLSHSLLFPLQPYLSFGSVCWTTHSLWQRVARLSFLFISYFLSLQFVTRFGRCFLSRLCPSFH